MVGAGWLSAILDVGNLIIVSANVIIGFSLLLYVASHNLRSSVARAFCALMACVTLVYVIDIALGEVGTDAAADGWLRFQWMGIALIPAAYLHFSDALLSSTGMYSKSRRYTVPVAYGLGAAVVAIALFTDWIVCGVEQHGDAFHLISGPGFWLFGLYYVALTVVGWVNISRARARCLTPGSRRRMAYLTLAFAAPAAGAFPYLLIPTAGEFPAPTTISVLVLLGNLAVAGMTLVMGYIVAYQGVLLPDRVVKHSLVHYMLRGPVVAIVLVVVMLAVPTVESILGLPRDLVMVLAVAGSVLVLQMGANLAKPAIDRVIYRRDQEELNWIQTLDQRLLTSADLEELLRNTLLALCDLLRIPSGFIVSLIDQELSSCVFCGPQGLSRALLERMSQAQLAQATQTSRQDAFVSLDDFVQADGHWLLPLRSQADGRVLGILGLQALSDAPSFSDGNLETVYGLVHRAETALEDMLLQQQVFGILQGLDSALGRLHDWRANPIYAGEVQAASLDGGLIESSGFEQTVRDALNQFWGGPKLSRSALRGLQIVRERLAENDHVPAKAVRAALSEAIRRLRPEGERSLTSNEWLVYNILDLKFVQGHKIRDIASRLAMSESDFYRKQRVAIEQVAQTLAQMERISQSQEGQDD